MNEEIEQERKRIKDIIEKEIQLELYLDRKEFPKRLNHIKEHIFFKIDNPNYQRKDKSIL